MREFRRIIFLSSLLSFFVFGLICYANQAWAESNATDNSSLEITEDMPEWIRPTSFQYSSEGKPDPFQSFIKKEPRKKKKEKKKDLTALESVEPSQLKLVGIIHDLDLIPTAYGLVELPNGKGYILEKGTKIGQKGSKVISIKSDKIIIHQDYVTILGKQKTHKIVLNLHQNKEGSNE